MKLLLSYILLFCYAGSFVSCRSSFATRSGQPVNLEAKDSRGNPELLGVCTEERLTRAPYDSWFVKNYNAYTLDSATADRLKGSLKGKSFVIFMGTWCGDSKREVPRIFRILRYAGIAPSSVQLVMVSDADSLYKQSPGHEEKGRDIFRVPDLIVLDHGRELGRIIESPVVSLEKDLLSVTGGEAYQPHYGGAWALARLFREKKTAWVRDHEPEVAAQLKPLVGSSGELVSYTRVLKAAGEGEKAAITLQINALLFPQ